MKVYRCQWCGRFYSSELPEGSACRDHVPEHNEKLQRDIEQFNAKLCHAAERSREDGSR